MCQKRLHHKEEGEIYDFGIVLTCRELCTELKIKSSEI